MPKKPPQLAKLSRPRLHKAVARERLFAVLDEERAVKQAICVVGPPGAGKTTLVASWMEARKLAGLWYQIDSGDSDLSTFFYYLGEGAKPFARKGHRSLPRLTPEYLQDVEGFSRRFFRELFSRLPSDAILVLDNYQEVSSEQLLHKIVAQAIDEIPAGIALIVISRRDPPDCYARLIANEKVCVLAWDELRFTPEETRRIASGRAQLGTAEIHQLHELSGGWAAGLTLLLEHSRRAATEVDPHNEAGIESIFTYFATQIFDRLPKETQHFLVDTAVLPRVTVSVAQALTGNAMASNILNDLYRRHLFTDRRSGVVPAYQYHALFQTFLKARARSLMSSQEEGQLTLRSAQLLEESGLLEDSLMLYRQAGAWDEVIRLIRNGAKALLAQGRGQTLRDWIGALPLDRAETDPWMLYWLGMSLIALDQNKARRRLELAFERFQSIVDPAGQALAACGVIDSYYFEWSDFRSMARWITALEPSVSGQVPFDSLESELHVMSSFLIASLYGAPGHSLLPRCVERATQMLDLELDVNHRTMAATFLISYCSLTGDHDRGRQVAERMSPYLGHADLSPLNQLWWRTRHGYFLWNIAEYEAADRMLKEAEQIAEIHGLVGLRSAIVLMLNYRMMVSIALEDRKLGEACVRKIEAVPSLGRRMGAWHNAVGRIEFELGWRNSRPAFEDGAEAVKAAVDSGMVYIQIVALLLEARGHADHGTHQKVMDNLRRADDLSRGTCLAHLQNESRLTEAYCLLRRGDEVAGRACLACALAHARKQNYGYNVRWTSILADLCHHALVAGIETDYVEELIRKYRIRPPSFDIERWPWPVRILTLGRFDIFRGNQRLTFAGKAPRKVLALLKAIIARGGEPIAVARLADTLWSDEEGDAARKAIDAAVLRLRRLLERPDAIVVRDEQIALSRDVCWVDAWAFARAGERMRRMEDGDAVSTESARSAMALYRGSFLPSDIEDAEAAVMRLKLRDLFGRLVTDLGRRYERSEDWEAALAVYWQGIDADELAEECYQGAMRCHARMGRVAEGMATFRRLRQTLSVVLSVKPSPKSEELMRLLVSANDHSGKDFIDP